MRTIYIPKDRLGCYIEIPVPEDTSGFHVVEVEDDFTINGLQYSPDAKKFVDKRLTDEQIDALRREAYSVEVDPLISEYTIKAALKDPGADDILASAIAAREAIQDRFPK